MKKTTLAIITILATVAIAWAGAAPWKTKPVDQWTDKDVQDILQNSPWSKAGIQPQGPWDPDGLMQPGGEPGTPGSSPDKPRATASAPPSTPEAMQKADVAAASHASYSIFWWSSRTIRGALMRRAVLKGSTTEAEGEKTLANTSDQYVLLVQGTNMQFFQHQGEQTFEKSAYLELKKTKQKVYPSKVAFFKGSDGTTVTGAVFYFPKKEANGEPTIVPDEKQITFGVQIGNAKLLADFDLRKMVDSKGEDL
jgi:hypothetical protein